jgi:hypothetical protein
VRIYEDITRTIISCRYPCHISFNFILPRLKPGSKNHMHKCPQAPY